MSRRGKNNVMRSIVHDASSMFSATEASQKPKAVPTNNFNPLFHYLQTMFPNYDNAVLNAVLEQEGNSIERAVEVLLTFAASTEELPKDSNYNEKEPAEITFIDDFSDTEETPSNVFAVPAMPPVTSHNSGRDHVSLYEQTRKKRKASKSQRARRRQRAQAATAAAAAAAKSKKVKWVPLEEFVVESKNPFEALPLEPECSDQLLFSPNLAEQQVAQPEQKLVYEEEEVAEQESDETQTLLTQEEIEESWEDFEASQQEVDEESVQLLQSPSDSGSDSEEWLDYTPSSPQEAPVVEEAEPVFAPSSSEEEEEHEEEDGFVVIEEPQTLPPPPPLQETLPATPVHVEDERSEQVVVVKLYYSASDIHRLGLTRRTLTFAKLYDYAATYLQSKCQLALTAKAGQPLAFALTYVDDEGDVIHLCSEEELAETLRLHDDVFWTDGKQPLLRLRVKSLESAVNDGHIVV